MMTYTIKDEVYDRIKKKFEDGVFTSGKECKLKIYYVDNKTIEDFSTNERTPDVYASLLNLGRCSLFEVPESARTRDFYINTYLNMDVNHYIQDHINDFDRQFFKDLIVTNSYAMEFFNNCFEIMPLEYIDEEMCSLAILNALNWSSDSWFNSVYTRKPEALTEDLWKLGARLYAKEYKGQNEFLNRTPEEYKDLEYYKEMCSCNFNEGMEADINKDKIMDTIPQEVITLEFVLGLLSKNIMNIARFNEKALETEIVDEKAWQLVVRLRGNLIQYIDLNDERVEFFLNRYDKDSNEYIYGFKEKYKRYKKQKENAEALEKTEQRTKQNATDTAFMMLMSAISYARNGECPSNAIDDVSNATKNMGSQFLPIKYHGSIPQELRKQYDSEEYLEAVYNKLGIDIVEEYDNLFYRVNLPEKWTIENKDRHHCLKNAEGDVVLDYFYESKIYDRDAYVLTIYSSIDLNNDHTSSKKLVKENKKDKK